MSYRRDFTISLKETQDFYLSLVLRRWRMGLAGFALVGALAVALYTEGMDWPVRAALTAVGALLGAEIAALVLVVSTRGRVRRQMRSAGRNAYVQETEISGLGVHVTVDGKRAKMPFPELLRVRETRRAFYLFLSEQQAWILPKAQMEDPQGESEQLRRLFRTVIEKRRLELRGRQGPQ